MGSMNSNNWLSFPLSPTHSSLPLNLHASQAQQFSLGLVNDNMESPFQNQGIHTTNKRTHIYPFSSRFSECCFTSTTLSANQQSGI